MALLIFFGLFIIFYSSLYLGKYFSVQNSYIQKIGASIYTKKIKQYETSKGFKLLRDAVEERSLSKGMGFIAPMIILKSVAFYFISILLIAPLILVLQGIAMGSLFNYYKTEVGDLKVLSKITFWQLLSHIIAATYGIIVGIEWIYNKSFDFELVPSNLELLLYGSLVLITGLVAANLEVKSLMNID